ncbi:MAG: mnmA [Acidimicrobiales bacterium]|jgi:tRNA-specific 2-thiouridylase|nr:mnmA [Acidimicrobiales bacterium]
MARALVAMSGGVDSSVAAALMIDAGHDVVGVTMKLWAGPSDSGCCSVADVEDARRVAQQLGIDHWVFNFSDRFDADVVAPYVAAHAAGRTPNPCVECNRHLKFDRLLQRAEQLDFDVVVTGHHARTGLDPATGRWQLRRGIDAAKDQSYVVAVLDQSRLAKVRFPVGEITKAEVRAIATERGLRTAAKPDSQDVCFISATGGRRAFLEPRIDLHAGRVVDATGAAVGSVDAVELVTVGQRRGLSSGGGPARYAIDVDPATATVIVGSMADLLTDRVALLSVTWVDGPVTGAVLAQTSAHGRPIVATVDDELVVTFAEPQRRVAPGQAVVLYRGDAVLGGGIAR